MRLFIAIDFSEEVKNKIGRIIEKLKERSVGGNFTRRENLHLTLVFLGETPESRGFKPHITICRKASLPRDFNKAELLEEISEISTTADDIVLMKSERISGRLTYTPI